MGTLGISALLMIVATAANPDGIVWVTDQPSAPVVQPVEPSARPAAAAVRPAAPVVEAVAEEAPSPKAEPAGLMPMPVKPVAFDTSRLRSGDTAVAFAALQAEDPSIDYENPFIEEEPPAEELPRPLDLPSLEPDPAYDREKPGLPEVAPTTPKQPAPPKALPPEKRLTLPAEPQPPAAASPLLGSAVIADDACMGDSCDGPSKRRLFGGGLLYRTADRVFGQLRYDAWLAQGVTINTSSPNNRRNFPVTFNNRSNDYQLNQAYLLLEKPIDSRQDRWQVGGRFDVLLGTDARFTETRGLEAHGDFSPHWNSGPYGIALPQFYAEAFAPVGNGLSVKLGHFYTILGYESVPAPDNFFYSHAYTMQYGEPFTHTGALASTRLGDVNLHGGVTRGWDNWEDNNNDMAFLGGVDWTSGDGTNAIAFAIHMGRESDEPPSTNRFRTTYSLVAQHRFTDRLQYVLQYDHGFEEGAARGGGDAQWFGINQYLFYTINPCWKAGLRYEWFRDADGVRVDPISGESDYFEISLGLNWTPRERLNIRPELRWDWADGGTPFVDRTKSHQFLMACDVIWRF